MECPRCGNQLERYTLGDRTAITCDECGYAGISVDHHSELQTAETWADAVSRVPDAGQIASVTVETATETPALELVFESPSDADDTPPDPTTVRVERPDPALAAALEAAADDDETFVCEVCGQAFERRQQLYGHLAVHTDNETEGA
jgi:DNA-directed RNA polymerase subunit M/transcription elongation factor TFIIS